MGHKRVSGSVRPETAAETTDYTSSDAGLEYRKVNREVREKMKTAVSQLVSWRLKPSQPQRITSGLRETFIKRYIVERTNKAELRPEEQSEKAKSCRENL